MQSNRIQMQLKQLGFRRLALRMAYKLINQMFLLQVFHLLRISEDNLNPDLRICPADTFCRLITASELAAASGDEELNLHPKIIADFAARGDQAFGLFRRDKLVSYAFYTTVSRQFLDTLEVKPEPGYTVIYKSRTKNSHRGRRFHGIGMTLALDHFADQGNQGLLGMVRASNFASLKSFFRAGSSFEGKLIVIKIFGKYFICSTNGFKKYMSVVNTSTKARKANCIFSLSE